MFAVSASNRQVVQSRTELHAAFVHCAKPHHLEKKNSYVAASQVVRAPIALIDWGNIVDPDDLITDVPPRYQLQGVSLAKTSQALFYRAIRATKPKIERIKTQVMLDMVRYAIKDQCGRESAPSDEHIWNSIRDKDISRSIRDYFWTHWLKIPGYEQWATCHNCNVDESMEHILVECPASGQDLIWHLCGQIWEKKHQRMPKMTLGLILGCGLAEFKDSKGKNMQHASRLFRIIVSESAHLIWKVRNERVIRGRKHTESEIHNRWLSCMNMQLKMDQLLTDRSRYGNRASEIKKVLLTWDGVLMDNKNLPGNWIWQSGVLVGIGKFRPLGRNR
ncbi:hypothetical protein B0H19DRAFT_1214591 [Mycena capillaripes]|nr:hypothetical protein B0H19DRAFT_1214591 [Mycena capillaripes]